MDACELAANTHYASGAVVENYCPSPVVASPLTSDAIDQYRPAAVATDDVERLTDTCRLTADALVTRREVTDA